MLNLVLLLSLSNTGHWKFKMTPHFKEHSEDLKKTIVALHKDDLGYKKIAKLPFFLFRITILRTYQKRTITILKCKYFTIKKTEL